MLQIEHAVQGPPTGSSGHKVPYLDVANTWSAAQTVTIPGSGVPTAGTALNLTSTAADAASGPNIWLLRDSASPAASDLLGCLVFQGRNDANALITYNQFVNQITSPAAGAESSVFSFWTAQAGAAGVRLLIGAGIYTVGAVGGDKGVNTINASALYEAGTALTAKYGQLATANAWSVAQTIDLGAALGTALTLRSSEPSGSAAPDLIIDRPSASPAVNDVLGRILFNGNNSALADVSYAVIAPVILDPVAVSGAFRFVTTNNNGSLERLRIGLGLSMAGTADMGAGTVNATALYEGGTALTAKYGQLAAANTWTAAQTINTTSASIPLYVIGTGTSVIGGFQRTVNDASGPEVRLVAERGAAGQVSDNLGQWTWVGRNASNTQVYYAALAAQIDSANSATIYFETSRAGSFAARFGVAAGLFAYGLADPGAGNINATALYESGNPISAHYAPGSGNLIRRNGGLEIWQRGAGGAASIAVPASGGNPYTSDGWYLFNGVNQACVVSQQAGLTSGSQWSAKVQRNSGQTGTGALFFGFPLDTDELFPMLGQFVCLSFTVKAGANFSAASGAFGYQLNVGTGAPAKSSAFTSPTSPINTASNITTTATRIQSISTVFVPTTTRQAEVSFYFTPVGTAGADDSFTIDDVQLEIVPAASGYVATAFQRLNFEEQLLLCQRHFCKTFNYTIAPAQAVGGITGEHYAAQMVGASTPMNGMAFTYPVPMRVAPTTQLWNPVSTNAQMRSGSADCTATSAGSSGNRVLNVAATSPAGSVAGTVLTIHITADAGI